MKTGTFLPRAHRSKKCGFLLGLKVKNAICDGTPPICTSNLIYIRVGKYRSPKSSNRIELSWLVLLHFYWFRPSTLPFSPFFFCCHSLLVVIIQSDLSQSSESMWVLPLTMRSLHHILQSLHWRSYMVGLLQIHKAHLQEWWGTIMGCCQLMFPITSVSSATFRQSTSWTFVIDPFLSFHADASVFSGDFSSISHLIWF